MRLSQIPPTSSDKACPDENSFIPCDMRCDDRGGRVKDEIESTYTDLNGCAPKDILEGGRQKVSAQTESCLMAVENGESRELIPRDDLIYIVDDTGAILRAVERMLQPFGKELKLFADASMAIKEIERTHELPAIIVTDYNMPNMTGLDLCKKMQEIDETKRPSVIVMSGRDVNEIGNMFFDAGAFTIIQKPDMGEVLHAVKSALLMKKFK